MIAFNGILNDNGIEKRVRVYLNDVVVTPYQTDFYIDDVRLIGTIDNNKIFIEDNEYDYYIKKCRDEIIIAGRETFGLLHWLMPCMFQPKFFVLTNKEEP